MKISLTVYCGPMFAGKSTALLKAWHEAPETGRILLKPAMDTRYGKNSVSTHDGFSIPALPVTAMPEIGDKTHVFLDEVQFMEDPWFSDDIHERVYELLRKGISVFAAGLDMDARGVPFAATAGLLAMADTVVKLTARCHVCEQPASMTSLRSPADRVQLGGSELYFPTCRIHHVSE